MVLVTIHCSFLSDSPSLLNHLCDQTRPFSSDAISAQLLLSNRCDQTSKAVPGLNACSLGQQQLMRREKTCVRLLPKWQALRKKPNAVLFRLRCSNDCDRRQADCSLENQSLSGGGGGERMRKENPLSLCDSGSAVSSATVVQPE